VISPEVKAEMARRTNWGRLLEPQHHLPPSPVVGDGGQTKAER
jgi:hypothetical protein